MRVFFLHKKFHHMKEEANQLLDDLIRQLTGKEDFEELRDQLFKRGAESLLKVEMTAHLGYVAGQKSRDCS